jgi:hypothetical protein
MRRILLLLSITTGLLVAAAPASAAPPTVWKGVVIAKDAKRGTVVTASVNGVVRTARSSNARSFRIGQRLAVRGTALADGTFKALSVKSAGRATTARVKAVVVRNQQAQKRLLVSAGGSTFALVRGSKTRALASVVESGPRPGDLINATVNVAGATLQATAISTIGRLGVLEVEGILTKIEAGSIELVVAKAGFVTVALPAGFAMPAGILVFDEVKAHVAVGTDGKLSLLSIQGDDESDRDDDGVDVDDDGEVEVTGTISLLSDTSITVSPGSSASPIICSLSKPLSGFAVNDRVEMECVAGATAGSLVLKSIEHEDDDEDDNDDDDDD